jgi:hypothetical protein
VTDFALQLSLPEQEHDDRGAAWWPTPPGPTRGCLIEHPPPTAWVCEPSAGDGAIAVELVARGHLVDAIECREECREGLERALPAEDGHVVTIGDWCNWCKPPHLEYSLVGNPPYNPAEECYWHVRHALDLDLEQVALLLPLAFGAASSRAHLLELHPPAAVRPLVPRPSFAKTAKAEGGMRDVAWYIWRRGDTSARFSPMWWRQYE